MTSKRFFAYTSILFLVPFCTALVFVSQSDVSFLTAEIGNSGTSEYSLTINDYDGKKEQTYYTANGNPVTLEFSNCNTTEEGFIGITKSSYIISTSEIHGIASLLITADNCPSDSRVHFSVLKATGGTSTWLPIAPNETCIIDLAPTVITYGFTVSFSGSNFVATGLTITYTCIS